MGNGNSSSTSVTTKIKVDSSIQRIHDKTNIANKKKQNKCKKTNKSPKKTVFGTICLPSLEKPVENKCFEEPVTDDDFISEEKCHSKRISIFRQGFIGVGDAEDPYIKDSDFSIKEELYKKESSSDNETSTFVEVESDDKGSQEKDIQQVMFSNIATGSQNGQENKRIITIESERSNSGPTEHLKTFNLYEEKNIDIDSINKMGDFEIPENVIPKNNSGSFTVVKHKKVELSPTPFSTPVKSIGTGSPNPADSNVLKMVASFTYDSSSVENKSSKSKIVMEKANIDNGQNFFSGQMLINRLISNIERSESISHENSTAFAVQFCTQLLKMGVLQQVSDECVTKENIFKSNSMYYWAHCESESLNKIVSNNVPSYCPVIEEEAKEENTSQLIMNSSPIGSTSMDGSSMVNSIHQGSSNYKPYSRIPVPLTKSSSNSGSINGSPKTPTLTRPIVSMPGNSIISSPQSQSQHSHTITSPIQSNDLSDIIDVSHEDLITSTATCTLSPITLCNTPTPKPQSSPICTAAVTAPKPPPLSMMIGGSTPDLLHHEASFSSAQAHPPSMTSNFVLSTSPLPPPPPPPPLPPLSSTLGVSNSMLSLPLTMPESTNVPPPPPATPPTTTSKTSSVPPPPPPMLSGVINMVPPPPPPPMLSGVINVVSPPPPPPPSLTVLASESNSMGTPIPPPPPSFGSPSPFPRPPPGGWNADRSTFRKKPLLPKVPMKPLYWTRLVVPKIVEPSIKEEDRFDDESKLLWDEIEEPSINDEEFMNLFSRQIIEKKVPKKKVETPSRIKVTKLLDSKRSQNVGILASSLHFDFPEIENAIYNFDTSVVSLEILQQIYEIRATDEEMALIKNHLKAHEDQPLDKPESFLLELDKIPNFSERISCFLMQAEFTDVMNNIRRKLCNLKATCDKLLNSENLKKVMAIILALGNFMNGGNLQRGQADGFGLDILPKLKDVKSKDNSVTLLQYIVRTYLKMSDELPVPEPSDVEQSSLVQFEDIQHQLEKLKKDLEDCAKNIEKIESRDNGDSHDEVFRKKLDIFLDFGRKQIDEEKEDLNYCKKKFSSVLKFYQFHPKGLSNNEQPSPKDFFPLWIQFCSDFKHIWRIESQMRIKEKLKEAKLKEKERRSQKQKLKDSGLKSRMKDVAKDLNDD